MNEFMWFIYLADVIPSAGRFFSFLAFLSGIAILSIGGGGFALLAETGWFEAAETDKSAETAVKWYKRLVGASVALFFVSSAVTVLIPDKQTIYAMAAVKAAEELSRTDIAAKAKNAIELTLDDVIKKYTPKKEKEGK